MNAPLPTDEHVCAYAIVFADGGIEGQLLQRGTKEVCEKVADMLPGVSYSGDRPVKGAHMLVMPAAEWDRISGATS